MASVAVNLNTSGDHNLGISSAGKIVRVRGIFLFAGGTVTVTIKDSSPATYTGPLPLSTTQSLQADSAISQLMDLTQGADLNLNLSGNIQVSGWIDYDLIG
jgi:hypothetical protein